MSTAQIRFHIGAALAMSMCAHGFMFVAVFGSRAVHRSPPESVHVQLINPRSSPDRDILALAPRGKTKETNKRASQLPGLAGSEIIASSQGAGTLAKREIAPLNIVKPLYTTRALRNGVEGEVVLELKVEKEGNVVEAKVLKGLGYGLDEAALEAILKSTFVPGCDESGNSVESRILYRFRFEITA